MATTPEHRAGGRGGRPAQLTRDDIVAAAVRVIDTDGLEALTMRRLGAELGVAAMSIYRHLSNRDAVLAAVVNHLAVDAVTDLEPGDSWSEALARFGTVYRRMLLAHPRAVPLLATHPMDIDTGLRLMGAVLDRFAAAGLSQNEALTAVQSVAVFVLGHALAQVGTPPGTPAAPPETPEVAEYYEHWFEVGLTAMVSGFAARHQR
ncbi:TetR/AcrR family transcriptional regulator [Plantactinospora soyae]|uniref:AcrR family transcriptional regulator n=1 Tax=Plantactinospora soyae TaxID=1544732 RepID=A0A927R5Y4_9ACTN|nr:TetR/AcrR family transcriptional regulator C-terminal domain-containing protein [Plantactinospora soyae]MBE1486346.1 AcrR family transcriptional regulator [Plantactinospora soyae]